jgi:hypothetical protein
MKVAERGKVQARVAQFGSGHGRLVQPGTPIPELTATQPVSTAALQLLDERTAPACRKTCMGQRTANVAFDSIGNEVRVGALAGTEYPIDLPIPMRRIRRPIERLVHVLVNTKVDPSRRAITRETYGYPSAEDLYFREALDPIFTPRLVDVDGTASFDLQRHSVDSAQALW